MTPPVLRRDGVPLGGEKWIAGGTTLVDLMKLGVERPLGVIDLGPRRGDLSGIVEADGGLTLGAMTTMAEAESDPRIRQRYPAVHLALSLAASPQIREMATLGGNLLQRTRCTYFRDGRSACNKRNPGAGCSAIGNPDEPRALFGSSGHCVATYPGDLAVALVALDATLTVEAAGGSVRRMAVRDLHRLPGDTPHVETALDPGDLITGIHLPIPDWTGQTYVKLRERASYAFASASAAVCVRLEGRTVVAARVALGGVASVPWRCRDVEDWLQGRIADRATFLQAGRACVSGADPGAAKDAHRQELCARAVTKAFLVACNSASDDGV
jgi:xanthine dehydrogenase YagS FAD-binding subunit